MKIKLAKNNAPGSVLDIDRLVESRLLIQGGSGSGKSTLARLVLEATAGKIQQIIVDPEGEFSTLRKIGDYLWCANDGDVPTEVKSASLLAKRIRQTGVSAVVDVYELNALQRQLFVKAFLEGLIAAPKKHWRESLVFVDETHKFAPQSRSSVCTEAVQDVADRGRKRKLALICATHRQSKLHKDVVAEMQNRMVGQTGLKNDLASVGEEMGLSLREAREHLVSLKPGQFYSFGPALAPEYQKFQARKPKTAAATADTKPVKASADLSRVIESLADLPKQAAKAAQTLSDLKTENANLKRDNTRLHKLSKQAGVPEPEVARRIKAAVKSAPATERNVDYLKIAGLAKQIIAKCGVTESHKPTKTNGHDWTPPPPPAATKNDVNTAEGLTGPEQRIVDAIAWLTQIGVVTPEQTAVAFLAGYRYGGGAFNNPRGRLRQSGLVEYVGKQIRLTDSGREVANFPDIEPTSSAMQSAVLAKLNGPEQRILTPLIESYPDAMSNEELATAAGYGLGGAFNNPKGRLRSLGLIDYPEGGYAVARSILFPQTNSNQ